MSWKTKIILLIVFSSLLYYIKTTTYTIQEKHILGYDPYLFLRLTKQIDSMGYLPQEDTQRYYGVLDYHNEVSPWDNRDIKATLPYTLYTLHLINPWKDIKKTIQWYPVIFGILGILITAHITKTLYQKYAILVIPILATSYGYMTRTLGGFADKEPLGIVLILSSIYLYLQSNKKKDFTLSILSGITMSYAATVWNGYNIYLIPLAIYTLLHSLIYKEKQYYSIFIITQIITQKIMIGYNIGLYQLVILSPLLIIFFKTRKQKMIILTLLTIFILINNPQNIIEKIKNPIQMKTNIHSFSVVEQETTDLTTLNIQLGNRMLIVPLLYFYHQNYNIILKLILIIPITSIIFLHTRKKEDLFITIMTYTITYMALTTNRIIFALTPIISIACFRFLQIMQEITIKRINQSEIG